MSHAGNDIFIEYMRDQYLEATTQEKRDRINQILKSQGFEPFDNDTLKIHTKEQ